MTVIYSQETNVLHKYESGMLSLVTTHISDRNKKKQFMKRFYCVLQLSFVSLSEFSFVL